LGTEDVNTRHSSRKDNVHLCKKFEVICVHIMTVCNVNAGHLEAFLCSRGYGECPSWSGYDIVKAVVKVIAIPAAMKTRTQARTCLCSRSVSSWGAHKISIRACGCARIMKFMTQAHGGKVGVETVWLKLEVGLANAALANATLCKCSADKHK
jgi:hypothetical protein